MLRFFQRRRQLQALEREVTRLHDGIAELIGRWEIDATIADQDNRDDRIYGQACRDHASELAQLLKT